MTIRSGQYRLLFATPERQHRSEISKYHIAKITFSAHSLLRAVMARIRRISNSSSNDLNVGKLPFSPETGLRERASPRKNRNHASAHSNDESGGNNVQLTPKVALNSSTRSKQIRLAPLRSLNSSNPFLDLSPPKCLTSRPMTLMDEPSPGRKSVPRIKTIPIRLDRLETDDEVEEVEAEVEGSVWCGSSATDAISPDGDLPSPSKFLPPRTLRPVQANICSDVLKSLGNLKILDSRETTPPRLTMSKLKTVVKSDSRPTSSSDKENHEAVLRFSPPRLYSSRRQDPAVFERAATPPPSPTKGKLLSPSKRKNRVPTPPHRASVGAFWDAATVNDWNDQHSPRKEWKSPKKLDFDHDDASTSPISSPQKSSPRKRTKAELEAKRGWKSRKHDLATSFLAELDQTIASGQISTLSASTGGVKIIWSKTLQKTAGRANWKCEKTKTQHTDRSITMTSKHHASIELAEKVIDDEERLLNVVAHEFCHLCNFMISGIKDQPHGKQFKEWGRQASRAFAHRGIEVTTKHTYAIDYKYIWQCSTEVCESQWKRQSKSIDPKKQKCGSCRGTLVQIKPVPRKETTGPTKLNGYAAFVKSHYAQVKRGMPKASQKEVMEAVAKKYRAEKTMIADEKQTHTGEIGQTQHDEAEIDKVVRVLEFVVLDDD